MKDIRCVFGFHIYSQAEAKVVDERKGYLITRVNMCCLRCGKQYEDIIAIPSPEFLQWKNNQITVCQMCQDCPDNCPLDADMRNDTEEGWQ